MPRYIDAEKIHYFKLANREQVVTKDSIDGMPTADMQEVKHGRWIKSPECPEEYDICSVCGTNDKHRTRANAEHPAYESIPPFCRRCGAKMDEKENRKEAEK